MEKSNTQILKDLIKYSIIDEVKHVEDISFFEELIFKVGMLGEKKAKYTHKLRKGPNPMKRDRLEEKRKDSRAMLKKVKALIAEQKAN